MRRSAASPIQRDSAARACASCCVSPTRRASSWLPSNSARSTSRWLLLPTAYSERSMSTRSANSARRSATMTVAASRQKGVQPGVANRQPNAGRAVPPLAYGAAWRLRLRAAVRSCALGSGGKALPQPYLGVGHPFAGKAAVDGEVGHAEAKLRGWQFSGGRWFDPRTPALLRAGQRRRGRLAAPAVRLRRGRGKPARRSLPWRGKRAARANATAIAPLARWRLLESATATVDVRPRSTRPAATAPRARRAWRRRRPRTSAAPA